MKLCLLAKAFLITYNGAHSAYPAQHGLKWKCAVCGEEYAYYSAMIVHLMRHHHCSIDKEISSTNTIYGYLPA